MDSTSTQPALEAATEPSHGPGLTQRQRWSELGLVALIAIAPLILSATAALVSTVNPVRSGMNFAIASRILHEASSLFLVFYLLSRRGQNLRGLGLTFDRWMDLPIAFGLTLGGLFFSAVLSILIRSVSITATGHPAEARDPRVIFAGISLGGFVFYSIGSAIFEEIIVRGYVMSEMIGLACPVWLAALTSIVLQTSYHVYYGWGGALALSGVFIVFAIYFAFSRRLLPVILGHLIMDLFATWVNHFR